MFGAIKDFIKFVTSMRGLFSQAKNHFTSMDISQISPSAIANFFERNASPELVQAVTQDARWAEIKNSRNLDEVKGKALQMASASGIPLFEGKSNQEIEDVVLNYGKSLGFLD